VLRVLAGMGERMVEFRVGEAPGVVGRRQGEKGGLAARELEQ
jgi:hypothetical protein